MKDYKPPFTITNEILSYVSSISEKVGRITATTNLESKPHLRKNNRIKSIHSSLRIEANSLSLGQVRDVINGKTVLGEQKEIQEVTFTNIPESMYVNDSFTVEYSKQEDVTATFVSSDINVATVEGEKVTAVAAGEFTLTATFTLGKETKEYTHKITVVNLQNHRKENC